MKEGSRPKFSFPRLRRVKFERFSLYVQRPDVDLSVRSGVFCLAGANGIGKSTFLAAVNFALTGRIPTPSRPYVSTSEYYDRSAQFPISFFAGRIEESDRSTASITVEFAIGDRTFSVTRGAFEPGVLRALRVHKLDEKKEVVILDGAEMSPSHRQDAYAEAVTEAIGLESFDQFVFLQHFVLTFDESRNLLFWNDRALESALFLAFDADPKQQTIADGYRREMERADSRGRNYRFHAIRVKTRVDAIRLALGLDKTPPVEAVALEGEYQALLTARDEALEVAAEAEAEAADANVQFANASAALMTLRGDYAQAFSRHIGNAAVTERHPLVLEVTIDRRCPVCGTQGENVAESVARKVADHRCPLCDSGLMSRKETEEDFELLRDLDRRITEARKQLEEMVAKRDRVSASTGVARHRAAATSAAVRDFETKHDEIVRRVQGRSLSGDAREQELQQLETEFATLIQESKQAYEDRDAWKKKLQNIQKKLERQYQAAERDFVPVFRELAEQFLGIDLDVVVEPRGTTGIALVLELRHSKRRMQYQLSESQRFFLDIALRMALARFISDPKSRGTLFIDTPEGSLDIAYESRAGAMFAKFAKGGHNILMTANINTSELLRKLAAECGESRMTLVRMTDWTDLSDVQLQESALFEQAYSAIEDVLHGRAS